jgi:hypothetical protein
MGFEVQCCFCGEAIAQYDDGGHNLDPCALVMIGNWKKPSNEQVEQQYFCHLQCFKVAVERHAPVDLELMASEIV